MHVVKSWLVGAPSSIQENAHSRLRTYNNISGKPFYPFASLFFRKADVTNALPAVMQFSRHALARAYMTLFSSSMSQVYPLSQFTDLFSKSSGNMNNLQDFQFLISYQNSTFISHVILKGKERKRRTKPVSWRGG